MLQELTLSDIQNKFISSYLDRHISVLKLIPPEYSAKESNPLVTFRDLLLIQQSKDSDRLRKVFEVIINSKKDQPIISHLKLLQKKITGTKN